MESAGLRQIDIGQIEQKATLAAGGLLLLLGFTRHGLPGKVFRLGGAALLFRGAMRHEPLLRALGIPYGGRSELRPDALRAESMIELDRPAEQLYKLWRDVDNLPAFMPNLLSVREIDALRSHWVAKGPAGTVVKWDAEIINDVKNELIAWQTLRGSSIDHSGSVHFDALDVNRTRVRIVLRYNPPGSKLGDAVARIFHDDPQSELDEALERFRKLIEVTTNSATVR